MALAPLRIDTIIPVGGLDLISPPIAGRKQACTVMNNYELDDQGLPRRMMGYERYDGKPAPSAYMPNNYTTDEERIADFLAGSTARRELILPVEGSGAIRGMFFFKGQRYAFRDDENAEQCHLYVASVNGWQRISTPTLLAGGSYQFIQASFGAGGEAATKLYGCDGVNPAFEFDGEQFTQIINEGMGINDTPYLIIEFANTLMLAYSGGSLQYSKINDPFNWDAVEGAGEIGLAGEITNLIISGGALVIICRDRIELLYGAVPSEFVKKPLSVGIGGLENSAIDLGTVFFMDDRGYVSLDRVQAFGDFKGANVAPKIQPLIEQLRGQFAYALPDYNKQQIRLFYRNAQGYSAGVLLKFSGSELIGCTEFNCNHLFSCFATGEDESGIMRMLAADDQGYVYQLDSGVSHDGLPYISELRPLYNHNGSVETLKVYKKISIEAKAGGKVSLTISPEFDYFEMDQPPQSSEVAGTGGGGTWNSGQWNEFVWSSAVIATLDSYISGRGRNISMYLRTESDIEAPHVIHGINIHFSILNRRR